MSRINKDNTNKELIENIRNRVRENRDNSLYEEQQLPLRTTKVKKKKFPPYKNKKNKTSFGKNSFGKYLGGGENKDTQTKLKN